MGQSAKGKQKEKHEGGGGVLWNNISVCCLWAIREGMLC